MDFTNMLSGNNAPQPRKRRQTMEEMLRESQLLETTVSLVDAVESAQAASARKAEAEEAAARAAANPPPAQPQPAAAAPASGALASDATPAYAAPAASSAPAPTFSDVTASSRLSNSRVLRYNLYARQSGRWVWQTEVQATSHAEGMQRAIAWLKPEHDALPIRLEQDEAVA